jgi:hypothetical protein
MRKKNTNGIRLNSNLNTTRKRNGIMMTSPRVIPILLLNITDVEERGRLLILSVILVKEYMLWWYLLN